MIRSWLPAAVMLVASTGCEPVMATLLDVDRVDAPRLRRWLAGAPKPILLDVRDPKSFAEGHVPGAVSLQLSQVDAYVANLPGTRERVVVTICNRGRLSLLAGSIVRSRGFTRVYSLRGGMKAWRARGLPMARGPGPRVEPHRFRLPQTVLSGPRQALAAASVFALSSLLLFAAVLLIVRLKRRPEPGLRQLRQGLFLCALGQACALSGVIFGPRVGGAMESVRSLCSVLALATLGAGLLVLVEHARGARLEADAAVGRRRIWLASSLALVPLAALPWSVTIRPLHLNLSVFALGLPLARDVWLQLLELRGYPIVAVVLLLVGSGLLLTGGAKASARARFPLLLGGTLVLHALLRWALLRAFRDSPAWLLFTEQLLWLAVITAVAGTLRGGARATVNPEAGGR